MFVTWTPPSGGLASHAVTAFRRRGAWCWMDYWMPKSSANIQEAAQQVVATYAKGGTLVGWHLLNSDLRCLSAARAA